jgi:hypothetical protein
MLSFVLLTALTLGSAAEDKAKKPRLAGTAAARLDRFKKLAGNWVGKAAGKHSNNKPVRVTYKVTAGGTAVMETLAPTDEPEMMSVIHRDGEDLVLTHYCSLGNQPRMKATRGGDDKEVPFRFTGITNLKTERDWHMHDVTYTFVDQDTLKTAWTIYKDGKEAETFVFEFKRKK